MGLRKHRPARRRPGPAMLLRRRPEPASEPVEVRSGSDSWHKHGPFTTGRHVDEYRIKGCIGMAGMANVYLAYHVRTNEAVAIKAPHTRLLRERRHQERFDTEIAFLRRCRHPNLPRLITVGETEGRRYLMTEYVPGVPLHTFLLQHKPRLSAEGRIELCLQVVAALIELQRLGIVHRDVKRENVIVRIDSRGRLHAVLIDCGLAYPAWSHETVEMNGTPEVVGPQQAQGCIPDIRDDLLSLGVMLYESLAEDHPAKDMGVDFYNFYAYLDALCQYRVRFKPLRERDASVPQPLADAVMRLLSMRREDRFQDGRSLAKALLPFVSDQARRVFRQTLSQDRTRVRMRRPRTVPGFKAA